MPVAVRNGPGAWSTANNRASSATSCAALTASPTSAGTTVSTSRRPIPQSKPSPTCAATANHDQITTALQKTPEDNPLNTADISVDPMQQTETIGLPDALRSSVRC